MFSIWSADFLRWCLRHPSRSCDLFPCLDAQEILRDRCSVSVSRVWSCQECSCHKRCSEIHAVQNYWCGPLPHPWSDLAPATDLPAMSSRAVSIGSTCLVFHLFVKCFCFFLQPAICQFGRPLVCLLCQTRQLLRRQVPSWCLMHCQAPYDWWPDPVCNLSKRHWVAVSHL